MITSIEYVFVEANPYLPGFDYVDNPQFDASVAALPTVWREALIKVIERFDVAQCWGCWAAIGFVLRDDGVSERLVWESLALAREGDGPIAALCEGCAPLVPSEPR